MNTQRLIIRNIRFYKREHLLVLAGIIISTAVLAASLMIGDSVKYSLRDIVNKRLGKTQVILKAQSRFFPSDLSQRLSEKTSSDVAPLLILNGIASADINELRIPDVQIIGFNSEFKKIANEKFIDLGENEVILNQKTANDLDLSVNDEILIRIEKAGYVNLNAPFVPEDENTVSVRMKVKTILNENDYGNFNLKTDQITPTNIFISLKVLSNLFFETVSANTLLISETGMNITELNKVLKEAWNLNDINLHFRNIDDLNKTELISDRIFIEQSISELLTSSEYNAKPVFSYLINFIRNDHNETPYSFAAALNDTSIYKLNDDEMIINDWTASDLNAKIGDSLELEYYTIGALRKLNTESKKFRLKEIVPIKGFAADSLLMPAFEGLKDVDHCSDWEAGIPMDYSKIRDKDESYWDVYRGTPKVFIAYHIAQLIWTNSQGDLTALRFDNKYPPEKISELILSEVDPSNLGFTFHDLKEESMWSANNAVDFAGLFVGLSFFLILAGFILTGLLFSILLNSRKKEQGILLSLGIRQRKIKQLFLTEGFIIAAVGSFFGLFGGILLNKAVLYFLNSIWYDIIRTSSVTLHIKPLTLLLAFFINVIIAGSVIWFTLHKRMKQTVNELNRSRIQNKTKITKWDKIVFISGLLIFSGIAIWIFISGPEQTANLFFINGFILLALLISATSLWLKKQMNKVLLPFTAKHLALKNLASSRKRNLSTIFILSIGVFIVISVGMNRNDLRKNADNVKSGTGGYDLFAETNIPVNFDLNTKDGLSETGLEQLKDSVSFVQFSAIEGDDASCLNLNRILRPRIISFDPKIFIERNAFSFVKQIEETDGSPWNLLNKELSENCIPAVADQTVIKWGLAKTVGDSISYLNEKGDTIHLVLVGGLANSIFQGNMIISEANLKKHYPSVAGSSIFLIESEQGNKKQLKNDLLRAFRNYGIKIDDTIERLTMFNSVTKTYLDIFLALGGIGLILGTFGIAIVLIRSINEQEHIFAMMQATGINRKQIQKVIRKEHFTVLISGLLIGIITAFAASLPALLTENPAIPLDLLLSIIMIILINGIIWIYIGTKISLKKKFIDRLRNE